MEMIYLIFFFFRVVCRDNFYCDRIRVWMTRVWFPAGTYIVLNKLVIRLAYGLSGILHKRSASRQPHTVR